MRRLAGGRFAGTRSVLAGYLVLVSLGCLVAGCDLFGIREPIPPDAGGGVPRKNPIDPDSTLCNVEIGIRYKTEGVPLYDESLDAEFLLLLDDTDIADLGTGLEALNKQQDVGAQQIQAGAAAAADSFYFRFIRDEPGQNFSRQEPEQGLTLYENIRYELQFLQVQGDTIVVRTDTLIRGEADILAAEDDLGNWVVLEWSDGRLPNPAPNQQTFGFWHGSVAVGSSPDPPNVVN